MVTSAKSVKSSSRSVTGAKQITGISKMISGNKEKSTTTSKTEEKITAKSQSGAMALKKALEKGKSSSMMSSSQTSSESVAASNESKQKAETVSRQTKVLKTSSTVKSDEASEYSGKNNSNAHLGGRTTMVVTLHPNLGEQHRLCSFKEKKVRSLFSTLDLVLFF